jgi:Acetyltransferases
MVRKAEKGDLNALLQLYTQLHDNKFPETDENLLTLWEDILTNRNYYIIVAEECGRIISSCTLVVIPNLTHGQRPYALIENVITDKDFRGRGFASSCLNHAREIADQSGCYKIMLLTGSKLESTHRFYENAGYNSSDKTAFIQWLNLS